MQQRFIDDSLSAYRKYKYNNEVTSKMFENMNFTSVPDFIQGFVKMDTPNSVAENGTNKKPLIDYKNSAFIKGLLLGAGLAYIATNKTVQQAVISTSVRVLTSIQGSFEEMKEQIQDVKAELSNEE